MNNMISIMINDQPILCERGVRLQSILQKENLAFCLCWDPRLTPDPQGVHTCGVECTGQKGIVLACHHIVQEPVMVHTNSEKVLRWKAHLYAMIAAHHPAESTLFHHNQDCILQAEVYKYAPDKPLVGLSLVSGRREPLGPSLNFFPDCCAECGLCVSFYSQVEGSKALQFFGTECGKTVGLLPGHAVRFGIAGNLVDLCPAGAFSHAHQEVDEHLKPPQEHFILDTTNGWGQTVLCGQRDDQIVHISPLKKNGISEWITDDCRYSGDAFTHNRVESPFLKKEGQLQPASWADALKFVVRHMVQHKPEEMAVLVGNPVDTGTLFLLKELLNSMGVYNRDIAQRPLILTAAHCATGLSEEILKKADACLYVGDDMLRDFPYAYMALVHRFQGQNQKVGTIGPMPEATPFQYLGTISTLSEMHNIQEGFGALLSAAENTLILVADYILHGEKGRQIYAHVQKIAASICQDKGIQISSCLHILHSDITTKGGVSLAFYDPDQGGLDAQGIRRMLKGRRLKFLYNINVSSIPPQDLDEVFVVYQGSYMDARAQSADVVFPAMIPPEEGAVYMAQDGNLKSSGDILPISPHVKPHWKIIRTLSELLGHKLDYNYYDKIKDTLSETLKNKANCALTMDTYPLRPLTESSWCYTKVAGHPFLFHSSRVQLLKGQKK